MHKSKELLEILKKNITNLETIERNVDLIKQFYEIIQEFEKKIKSNYTDEIFKHIDLQAKNKKKFKYF